MKRSWIHRGALVLAVAAIGLVWLYMSPRSPMALWRADFAASFGHPVEAVRVYDRVAEVHRSEDVRNKALRRSIVLWSTELGDAEEALERTEKVLESGMSDVDRARWLALSAELAMDLDRPEDAAAHWRHAHDLDPQSPQAPLRLSLAGRAALVAGKPSLSEQIWKQLAKRHPAYSGNAHIERANLRLMRDDVQGARSFYERAAEESFDPDVATVARLGVATCLERLGELEQAVAELDRASGLPFEVRERRSAAILSRERTR